MDNQKTLKNSKFYRRDKKNGFDISVLRSFFIFLIVILTSISLVNAFEWDNVKNYNPETKTATITNALGFGNTIAEITLDSPQINYVIRGKDRLVAEFTIDNKESYERVFNDLKFYDIKQNMRGFNRDYVYRYKTVEDYEVPNYEEVCEYSEVNKTEQCYQVKKGTTTYQRDIWNDFNSRIKLLKGKITIGIFTDVYMGDNVEWIPELFGVKIDEWAVWTESLGEGLTSYFDFNGSGTNLPNLVNGSLNGTSSDTAVWKAGIIGNASEITGANEYYFNISNISFWNVGGNNSVSFWYRVTDIASQRYMFATAEDTSNFGGTVHTDGTTQLWGGEKSTTLSLGNQINRWTHVVIVQTEGGVVEFYINGTLETTSSSGSSVPANRGITIGSTYTGVATFRGKIDEFGVWNRTLTSTEVTQLYNNGSGIAWNDEFDLRVDLVYPSNDTDFFVQEIGFNATHNTTTSTLKNTTLYIWNSNGTIYKTNETNITGTSNITNLSITFDKTNEFLWNYYTCNLVECNFSINNYTIPIIHMIENAKTYNNNTIESATEEFILNITIGNIEILDNSTFWYNNTPYSATITGTGRERIITNEIKVPSLNTTIDFWWELFFSSGSVNSTTSNQTIVALDMDDCSEYSNLVYNFTIKDEGSQSDIAGSTENTTAEINLEVTPKGETSPTINYSELRNATNPFAVCLNVDINNTEYRLDGIIKYSSTDRVEEYYHIQNTSLTNSTWGWNISLYNLLSTDSTSFIVSYTNEESLLQEGVLVHLMRYYIEDGEFKEVENGQTNNDGETILHLVEEDVIYIFNVTLEGIVLYTSDEYRVYCVSGEECRITLDASAEFSDFPDDWAFPYGNYTLTAEQSTRDVTLSFILNESATMNLTVYDYSNNESQMSTIIGSNSTTASSGTITVNVPLSYGNKTYYAVIEKGSEFVASHWATLTENPRDYFGDWVNFLVGMMVLSLGLVTISSGIGVIIFSLLGVFIAGILQILDVPYSVFIYVFIAGIILLIKLLNRKAR